jgi:hypothetical protein
MMLRRASRFAEGAFASIFAAFATTPSWSADQDGKFYPGTMCRIAEEDHEHRDKLRYGASGFVVNNSTTDRVRVVCPIIRDEMNTNRGVTVRVFFHDSNPTDALACELFETHVMGHKSTESNRKATPMFRPVNVDLGTLCNAEILDRFPQHFPEGYCSLTLKTNNSAKWNRAEPGSGLHMVCGIPAKSSRDQFLNNNVEFSGRSGIGGYYVEETTQ